MIGSLIILITPQQGENPGKIGLVLEPQCLFVEHDMISERKKLFIITQNERKEIKTISEVDATIWCDIRLSRTLPDPWCVLVRSSILVVVANENSKLTLK